MKKFLNILFYGGHWIQIHWLTWIRIRIDINWDSEIDLGIKWDCNLNGNQEQAWKNMPILIFSRMRNSFFASFRLRENFFAKTGHFIDNICKCEINFWSKMTSYLSLGLYKWRLKYRRCLQPLKHSAFLNSFLFCGSFLPSCIRIRIQ